MGWYVGNFVRHEFLNDDSAFYLFPQCSLHWSISALFSFGRRFRRAFVSFASLHLRLHSRRSNPHRVSCALAQQSPRHNPSCPPPRRCMPQFAQSHGLRSQPSSQTACPTIHHISSSLMRRNYLDDSFFLDARRLQAIWFFSWIEEVSWLRHYFALD